MGDLAFAQGPLAHQSYDDAVADNRRAADVISAQQVQDDAAKTPKYAKPFDQREAINPNPGGMK